MVLLDGALGLQQRHLHPLVLDIHVLVHVQLPLILYPVICYNLFQLLQLIRGRLGDVGFDLGKHKEEPAGEVLDFAGVLCYHVDGLV